MAFRGGIFMVAITLLLGIHFAEAQVGVCYGMVGNLPPPSEVIDLYKQHNIQRMRMFGSDEGPLEALRGTNIELMVGIFNSDLQQLAYNQNNANKWVQNVIKNHPNVKFRYISVGNEVNPLRKTSRYIKYLLPAMRNIYNAVNAAGYGDKIKVSTAVDTGILAASYPPSRGAFKSSVRFFIDPVVDFLVKTRAPLLVNVYPYFSYASKPRGGVGLDHAIFNSTKIFAQDGPHRYWNVFDALLDATYSALEKVGGGSVEIVVSETGWPSAGGSGTSIENARIYNSRLIQHVKNGTPKRPGKPIETYIFGMFNENKSPEVEKHWGLFYPNKQPKYSVEFN